MARTLLLGRMRLQIIRRGTQMNIKQKAQCWDKLQSAFRDSVDWRYLEYIAVKVHNKEVQVVRFG